MIGNLFIVCIAGGTNLFPAFTLQNFICKAAADAVLLQAAQVFADFPGNGRRKHTGIGSRIGNQLFLVKLLNNFQRFIRTDFEKAGTVVLQLRKVVKQWRIFIFLFFAPFSGHAGSEDSARLIPRSVSVRPLFSGSRSPYREAES